MDNTAWPYGSFEVLEGLKILSTITNNDTNEKKDATYDSKYFLYCYWVISSNYSRTQSCYCLQCPGYRSAKTHFTLTSTVQLPFTRNVSLTQTQVMAADGFRYSSEIFSQQFTSEKEQSWFPVTKMRKYLVKTKLGKHYSLLFIERPNLPSVESTVCNQLPRNAQVKCRVIWYVLGSQAHYQEICGEFFVSTLALFRHDTKSFKYRATNRDIRDLKQSGR